MEVGLNREAKDFQKKDKKYELSALLNVDSFFYGLYDYGLRLVYSNDLESIDMLSHESWKDRVSLRRTKIGFLNNLHVIIPETEFQMADISSIVRGSCDLSDVSDYIIRSDSIEKYRLRVCYAIPKGLVKLISQNFDGPVLNHFVSALIDGIQDITKDSLYLDYSCQVLTMIACKEGKFQLINSYDIVEDINAFYLMAQVHHSVFGDDQSVPIYYSGKDIESSSLVDTMRSYYPQVRQRFSKITMDGEAMQETVSYYPLQCISEL